MTTTGGPRVGDRQERVKAILTATVTSLDDRATPKRVEAVLFAAGIGSGEVRKAFSAMNMRAVNYRGTVIWALRGRFEEE